MLKLAMISFVTFGSLMFAGLCRAETRGKDDKDGYAMRNIEGGTKVNLIVGDTVIPGVLNDSKSSKALIAKLPYTVRMQRYEHDYCGVMKDPLPYDEEDMRNGWLNGDISFAVDGNYFTILYKDEAISQQFDGIVNMGVISAPLSVMDTLDRSISVRIELE